MPKRYVLLTLSIPEEEMDLAMGILGGYPLLGVEQGLDECTVCFEQNDWQQISITKMILCIVVYKRNIACCLGETLPVANKPFRPF